LFLRNTQAALTGGLFIFREIDTASALTVSNLSIGGEKNVR